MATRTAKLRVEIDGEKEYKQALSELNKGNQVLASEMRKLSAEYKGNEDSVEALTAKGDVLQRQLLQQKDKVQTLRDALANAANQYGEADKRTQDWQIKLNDAEAAQINLERAIEENNEAIDQQNKGFSAENETVGSLGDQVQQLAGKLGINLPDGATKALGGIQGFSAGTMAAMAAAAAAIAAVIKILKELHDLTVEQAANVDELITESMVSGVSTQTLQQWQYAENLIDVSVSTMTGSLSKLTRTMYDAQAGNAAAQASFEALGVSYQNTDGTLRSAEETFYDVIDALGQVGNTTERDALAMDVMGRSAQELNPLILQGSDALRELAEEAEETGYVLDESQIKKLGELDDAVQRNKLQWEALQKQMAAEFAPASQKAMEVFAHAVEVGGKMLIDSHLLENLAMAVESVLNLIDAGVSMAETIPGWMNPLEMLSNQFKGLAIVVATVADAINLIEGLKPWNWGSGKATTALGWNINEGQMSNLQKLKYGSSDRVAYNASGNDNWRGGLTYLNEAGPEAVFLPNGTRILNAQDTRALGGSTTYNINVANVQELQQLLDLMDGLRVRRRMA